MPTLLIKLIFVLNLYFLFFAAPVFASDVSRVSTKYGCTGVNKSQNLPLLNIATFNIGKGNEPTKATAIANLFEKYDVDILGMQELYRYGDEYQYTVVDDIPVAFANKFPGKAFYYYSKRQRTDHSLTIVSKFPIIDGGFKEITGGRGVLHAYIDTPYGMFSLFDTHLQRGNDLQTQCSGLRDAISYINNHVTPGTPFLLIGDYNLEKDEVEGACGPIPMQNLKIGCTGAPCYLSGIDFLLPGITTGPEVLMICANPDYLMDSHEFYVSTVRFGSPAYISSIPYDLDKDFKFDFSDIIKLLTWIFK